VSVDPDPDPGRKSEQQQKKKVMLCYLVLYILQGELEAPPVVGKSIADA
jgi:hypothetical protein